MCVCGHRFIFVCFYFLCCIVSGLAVTATHPSISVWGAVIFCAIVHMSSLQAFANKPTLYFANMAVYGSASMCVCGWGEKIFQRIFTFEVYVYKKCF